MKLPIYQVDAFASSLFRGNPAAICPLESWIEDATMQAIAAENNVAETAFYVPLERGRYGLRWFTPEVEVALCGHATIATAAVILHQRKETSLSKLYFDTKSGEVTTEFDGDLYHLDFPSRPPLAVTVPADLTQAMGVAPTEVLAARDGFCVFETAEQVRALKPDMAILGKLPWFAVIATAPGEDCDFVSRFFAPAQGLPEDPVTGSAHCTLIPYWASRLGKEHMFARQISARGGEIWCHDRGARVGIAGRAVPYLEGTITLP